MYDIYKIKQYWKTNLKNIVAENQICESIDHFEKCISKLKYVKLLLSNIESNIYTEWVKLSNIEKDNQENYLRSLKIPYKTVLIDLLKKSQDCITVDEEFEIIKKILYSRSKQTLWKYLLHEDTDGFLK